MSIATTLAGSTCCAKSGTSPLYATALTQEVLGKNFRKPPRWRVMSTGAPFELNDLRIECFPVPHDAVEPRGLPPAERDRPPRHVERHRLRHQSRP